MCQHNLPCSIVYAHCLRPGRAFASLYVLLFLEKETEIGGREQRDVYLNKHYRYPMSTSENVRIYVVFGYIRNFYR